MTVKTVWIEDGCILCSACVSECPEVFVITGDSCLVRMGVREDGLEDANKAAKSPLKAAVRESLNAGIKAAVSACPVEVIKFE